MPFPGRLAQQAAPEAAGAPWTGGGGAFALAFWERGASPHEHTSVLCSPDT